MAMLPPHAILWPAVALAALTWGVWFKLFVDRMAHMKARPAAPSDFATTAAAMRYFQPVEMPANNLRNLFEMPVLFYAVIAMLYATGLGDALQLVLGAAYVLLRAGHSYEHIVTRAVGRRFAWYLASSVVLLAMWIGFAVDLALLR